MITTRNLGLVTALGLAALLASGAAADSPKRVSSPTPEIVTLSLETSQPSKRERATSRNRMAGTMDDNDRGVLLLFLLSAPPTR
ncbi:MAG: hypothetical protein DMD91_22000 [Candidatus Rokuibacteriota bacterium]|nr:MAG: hypothetical protein DMD91_22000 [Candidatus Rokubacteria bacterium]